MTLSGNDLEHIGEVVEDALRKSITNHPGTLIEAMDRVLRKSHRKQSAHSRVKEEAKDQLQLLNNTLTIKQQNPPLFQESNSTYRPNIISLKESVDTQFSSTTAQKSQPTAGRPQSRTETKRKSFTSSFSTVPGSSRAKSKKVQEVINEQT